MAEGKFAIVAIALDNTPVCSCFDYSNIATISYDQSPKTVSNVVYLYEVS